ncbi:hypothetical protein ACFOLJ_25620 [Rugamonas sp. CCM 8940]|uniref:hypothetical protein n=1 Tax=Rugamonas sp. CCM 8940 TaxID=2765359 RepID=UPI0018F72DC0|nr:hypothetical protein [Rugamonas sp. CCM 8940]MBJ7309059.1 hypothetical protein [Rugamonas sp. CCM 8940]
MSDAFDEQNVLGKSIDKGDSSKAKIKHQNDALDEALRESFPASDPIAVSVTRIDKEPSESELSRGVGHGEKNE